MGRKSKTTVINSLEVNPDTITDHKAIAQELNNHFSTIADKISAEAEKNNEKTIGDKDASVYLSFIPKKQNPFKFQAITPHNIIRCISKMKNSKSGKIATKFVKDSIEITAPMLSIIFNKSISWGVFPKNLKIGKVCPIYKGKGSKSYPDNYRPITVHSVIANQSSDILQGYLKS